MLNKMNALHFELFLTFCFYRYWFLLMLTSAAKYLSPLADFNIIQFFVNIGDMLIINSSPHFSFLHTK